MIVSLCSRLLIHRKSHTNTLTCITRTSYTYQIHNGHMNWISVSSFWLEYLSWLFYPWLTEFFPHGFMCFRIYHLRWTKYMYSLSTVWYVYLFRFTVYTFTGSFGTHFQPAASVYPCCRCYVRNGDNVIAHNFVIPNRLIIYCRYIATLHFRFWWIFSFVWKFSIYAMREKKNAGTQKTWLKRRIW